MEIFKDFIKKDLEKLAAGVLYFSVLLIFVFWAESFYMDSFAAVFIVISGILLYFCASRTLQAVYLFVIGCSVLFQNHLVINYSYPFAKIGREILVLVSETTTLEFKTYLQIISGKEYMDFVCLLLSCLFIYKMGTERKNIKAPIFLGLFLACFALWNDIGAPVYAFREEMSQSSRILESYRKFRFDAQDVSGDDESTYIIVIGETHRHDHFEKYAYSEKYSPNLYAARKRGDIYSFDNMTSGYYYTTGSVPLILTRKPVDCETRFFEEKSIVSAFKEAGYATWTISYSKKTQPEDDAMNLLFLEADEYINHYDTSGTFDDVGMLPTLEKILSDKSKKKKLILIKMIGAHYLYEERYPKDFEIHKPSYKSVHNSGEAANDHKLLRNSYKNAVIYSATFIDKLAGMLYKQKEPAMMAFISDHGTCLYEDGASKFVGRAKGAYHIAFFVTGNQRWLSQEPPNSLYYLKIRKDQPLTQEYFLDTYLSLAKIKYFDPRPKRDISGSSFVPAENRKVWTPIGLEKYDDLMPEHSLDGKEK